MALEPQLVHGRVDLHTTPHHTSAVHKCSTLKACTMHRCAGSALCHSTVHRASPRLPRLSQLLTEASGSIRTRITRQMASFMASSQAGGLAPCAGPCLLSSRCGKLPANTMPTGCRGWAVAARRSWRLRPQRPAPAPTFHSQPSSSILISGAVHAPGTHGSELGVRTAISAHAQRPAREGLEVDPPRVQPLPARWQEHFASLAGCLVAVCVAACILPAAASAAAHGGVEAAANPVSGR